MTEVTYSYTSSQFEHPVHVSVKSKNDRNVLDEIDDFPLPPEIKKRAQDIYVRIGMPTHRGKKRKQLLFYCIYNGNLEYNSEHTEIEEDVDPGQYERMIGISHGDVRRAVSMFSEVQTGYRPKTGKANPLGMIHGYCTENNISTEMVEPIKDLGKEVLHKDTSLLEESPQKVAAGLIKYFLTTSGIEIDNKLFSQKIRLSEATINGMCKRIAMIDNR